MKLQNMRKTGFAGLVVMMMLLTVGCTATTHVTFRGPPGSVLFVDGKPHHLPADVALSRPGGDSGSTRHDVKFVAGVDSRELRTKGHIDMFGYSESDVDTLAVHTCVLDESELASILDGKILVYKGQTASRQPLYELTLAKE